MINVIQHDEYYHVSFPYDPKIVQLVKNVPGRTWNPDGRYWSIPLSHLGMLIAQFRGTPYESKVTIKSTEELNINQTIDETDFIPNVDLSNVHLYSKAGTSLYSHQLDFMKYAIARENRHNMNGFLVCDEMGCLTGDTQIWANLNGVRIKLTLEELHHYFEDKKEQNALGRCYAKALKHSSYSSTIEYLRIKDVVYSGRKEVYEITTKRGYQLRATVDHPLLYSDSISMKHVKYVEVERLKIGDRLVVDGSNHWISRLTTDKIASITYVGIKDVYDIKMVGPFHNFIANGIVVHNCGKTVESINLALFNKEFHEFQHCLVLCCINMSKYNWQEEVQAHTRGQFEGYILGSRIKKNGRINYNGSSKHKLEDLKSGHMYGDPSAPKLPYFLILNVEAIRMSEGKEHPIADILIELIKRGELNMVIIDEVHKNVSPTSQQGKQLLRIKRNTKTMCMWLPMTGTPIVNKPTDLFVPLRLVEGHSVNSYYQWNKNFCVFGGYGGHEIVGYKNMEQLKTILQHNMIRRLKENILDLPEKIEIIEYVENTPFQNKLQKTIEADLRAHREEIVKSLNPLTRMLKLRQINGSPELVDEDCHIDDMYLKRNAKLVRLLELIDEIVERNEKVVVFSNWVEPLRTIYRFLAKNHKVCCFTGTMKEEDRDKHKKVFQENPDYKIMIGTIGSLGTSHTLTAANNVIFYDESWTAADRQQAVDRLHRLGATKSINVYTLISKGTIDERVHKILYSKDTIAKFMVDNQIDIYNNPELFDVLLGN